MLIADYHTHTRYSHGKGEPEDIVRAAIAQGLKRIAISEHGPKHLFFPVKWEALLELRREVDRLQDAYGSTIRVELGLEANILGSGVTDVPEDDSIFDFVLFGYHKGTLPVDAVSRRWMRSFFGRQNREKRGRENAEAYARAMDNTKKLFAITHPDTYIPVDVACLAREAAERGIALELNEAHKNFTLEQAQTAYAQGCSFIASSDAHRPERVGRCENSIALAREAGILHRVINWEEDPLKINPN